MLSTQGMLGQSQMAGAPLEGLTHLRLAGPITAATSAGARQPLHRSEFRSTSANRLVIRALKQTRTLGVFDVCAG